MVVHQCSPSERIAMLEMTESSFEELEGMAAVLTDKKDVKLVPWTNTHDMRPLTLAALAKSSHSTRPNPALNRMRCRTITSAAKSLDILRQNLQAAINKEIDLVIKKYIEKFFQPAMKNIRDNLGAGSVTEELVREVCRAMLEGAKQMYCSVQALHGSSTSSPPNGTPPQFQAPQQVPTRKRKLSTGEKSSLTWPEIYPPHIKWDPSRVNKDTQFILSTTASKVLGLGSIRGRLSLKHPELVRYSLDQDDREWLLTAGVSGIFQGTPNIALVLMEDIVQLANWEEYRSSPLLCVHDLKGFCVPDFIQRKVRAYMTLMRSTKYIEPSPPPQPPSPHPQQPTSSPPPPLSPGPCLSPAPSLSPPPLSPPHSCSLSPIPLSPPCLSSSSSLPSPSLPSTSFPSPSLPSPSLSSTSLALSSLSLPSETTSLSAEDLPIQMSIDVECLPSSVAPLSLLDSGGLIEFDLPFFSLITGDEED